MSDLGRSDGRRDLILPLFTFSSSYYYNCYCKEGDLKSYSNVLCKTGESIDFFGYFLVEVFQHASLLLGVTFCTGREEIDCSFDGLLLG